jgi:hypothetical protein
MTKLPVTTPSVAFGLASFTATALGIHLRTSRSCISCSKNMPDPKSSTSARSSPRGNPRTLCSLVERGRDLHSQTSVGTAAVSSRSITSPTSTPLVRPLAAKIIPSRAEAMELVVGAEDERSSRADFTVCFTAKTVRTQQGTARKRRPPGTGCLGRNQPTTQELSHTHIYNSHLHTRNSQTSTTQTTPKHQNKKTTLISRIAESFT